MVVKLPSLGFKAVTVDWALGGSGGESLTHVSPLSVAACEVPSIGGH